jgi:hypothetical protein
MRKNKREKRKGREKILKQKKGSSGKQREADR